MFGPTQLPSLRWQAGYKIGRKGAKVTRTFDTYGEAQEWAEAAEAGARAELLATAPTPPMGHTTTAATVSTYGTAWLARKGHLAKATRDGYGTALRRLGACELGARPMAQVRRSEVETWRTAELAAGTGRPTINATMKVLRMLYLDALAEGEVGANPTHGLTYLTLDISADRVVSPIELGAMLADATPTMRAMILLGTQAGLRWGEVAGLPVSAVGVSSLHVRQVLERSTGTIRKYPKGHRDRRVPIVTDALSAALRPVLMAAGPDPDALLFTSKTGTALDYWDWRRDQWRPLLRAAGLNPRPRFHDLRHTYGSTLAAGSMPRSQIAHLMGHADEATTARYIHTGEDEARATLVRQALAG